MEIIHELRIIEVLLGVPIFEALGILACVAIKRD